MRTVDDIYMSLGQGIIDKLPADCWSTAWINATVVEDASGVDGEYLEIESKELKYFEVDDQAFDDFEDLHQITTEGGANQWNRAKFTLHPSGEFDIKFDWDQKLADEVS